MIVDILAEIKIRLGRGQQWFYEFRNAVLIGASLKILFEMTLATTLLVVLLVLIGFVFVGFIDLKWIGLMQKEQELSTSKYNPHLNKLSKLVRK